MSITVRKDHRGRICRIIKWLQEHYPDIADTSVCVVTIEDREDPRLYIRDADEYDFVYSGLNTQYILGFLADLKNKKEGGKFYGPSHISNFFDAIKWGSLVTNRCLSTHFYTEMDKFMACYKKELSDQNMENIDEQEADALRSTQFKLILKWAVEEGNLFVWCFALLMWHLMARSINVDCLSLHNIKHVISDFIVFKYDETKMDKTGEFLQEKNCYSNPLRGQEHFCLFTALGCYLSINQECLSCTEKIFINPHAESLTASQSVVLSSAK